MSEGGHIGLLDDVLSLAVIAHDAAGEAIELLVVLADDGSDGVGIAALGSQGQFKITRGFDVGLQLRHVVILTIGCSLAEKVPENRRLPIEERNLFQSRLPDEGQMNAPFSGDCATLP